eukprot:gene25842-biopygen9305
MSNCPKILFSPDVEGIENIIFTVKDYSKVGQAVYSGSCLIQTTPGVIAYTPAKKHLSLAICRVGLVLSGRPPTWCPIAYSEAPRY